MTWAAIIKSLKHEEKRFRDSRLELAFPHLPFLEFTTYFERTTVEADRHCERAIKAWLAKGRWPKTDRTFKYFLHTRIKYAIERAISLSQPHYPSGKKMVSEPLVDDPKLVLEWLLINHWLYFGSMRLQHQAMGLWLHLDARADKKYFFIGRGEEYSKN